MHFLDLEYVALEGGGGKGAVYKGAIVALEKLFDNAWHEGKLLRFKNGNLTAFNALELLDQESSKSATSILDYSETGDTNPKIKGISGSSAGAITAFPLALGLNSTDIAEILKSFPFSKEFLPNHKLNEGKYRMVGMGSNGEARILIAEDHFKKLGEDKLLHYEFTLQDKDLIGKNLLKSTVRSALVSSVFSIIFTGFKENWALISRFVSIVGKFLNNYNYLR